MPDKCRRRTLELINVSSSGWQQRIQLCYGGRSICLRFAMEFLSLAHLNEINYVNGVVLILAIVASRNSVSHDPPMLKVRGCENFS